MKHDLAVYNGIIIPDHELEITASRSGGPGGQHVNKTSSRITVRWNVKMSQALTEEQKTRIIEKLGDRLTSDGDLLMHSSASRSQQHNKKVALEQLADIVAKALRVPKKRKKTGVSKHVKEERLKTKSRHALIKKLRSKKSFQE